MENFSPLHLIQLLLILIAIGIFAVYLYFFKVTIDKKKTELSNRSACRRVKREHRRRLWTDYFWSDAKRFAWIMLFITFFIALGLALAYRTTGALQIFNLIFSLFFFLLSLKFLHFAYKSYKAFPSIASAKLQEYEEQVEAAIKKEISFNGDNIQSFSDKDSAFDTEPTIFSFPIGISKVPFPPFEKNAKKQPIIATKKLEFLVLSREYFSICQKASTFNLLEPDRAGIPKKCAELPGRAGECHEHYYSQMRNVEYDATKECIRIIYYDERDDVELPCKKLAPNRVAAMKALKEKLRLTERQRLRKIDEHEKYEEIKNRRGVKEEIKDENKPNN